jgi:predicted nucleic acid-binding protein
MAEGQPAFVDANVFIDVARKRKGWEASSAIVSQFRKTGNSGFISLLSAAIIYFVFLWKYSPKQSVQELEKLVEGFEIVDLAQEDFGRAVKDSRVEDFEDRLQFYAARKVCKIMITRNKKHYRNIEKEIEVLTPEDFMGKYLKPNESTDSVPSSAT